VRHKYFHEVSTAHSIFANSAAFLYESRNLSDIVNRIMLDNDSDDLNRMIIDSDNLNGMMNHTLAGMMTHRGTLGWNEEAESQSGHDMRWEEGREGGKRTLLKTDSISLYKRGGICCCS
jgi:hypothetical protein